MSAPCHDHRPTPVELLYATPDEADTMFKVTLECPNCKANDTLYTDSAEDGPW